MNTLPSGESGETKAVAQQYYWTYNGAVGERAEAAMRVRPDRPTHPEADGTTPAQPPAPSTRAANRLQADFIGDNHYVPLQSDLSEHREYENRLLYAASIAHGLAADDPLARQRISNGLAQLRAVLAMRWAATLDRHHFAAELHHARSRPASADSAEQLEVRIGLMDEEVRRRDTELEAALEDMAPLLERIDPNALSDHCAPLAVMAAQAVTGNERIQWIERNVSLDGTSLFEIASALGGRPHVIASHSDIRSLLPAGAARIGEPSGGDGDSAHHVTVVVSEFDGRTGGHAYVVTSWRGRWWTIDWNGVLVKEFLPEHRHDRVTIWGFVFAGPNGTALDPLTDAERTQLEDLHRQHREMEQELAELSALQLRLDARLVDDPGQGLEFFWELVAEQLPNSPLGHAARDSASRKTARETLEQADLDQLWSLAELYRQAVAEQLQDTEAQASRILFGAEVEGPGSHRGLRTDISAEDREPRPKTIRGGSVSEPIATELIHGTVDLETKIAVERLAPQASAMSGAVFGRPDSTDPAGPEQQDLTSVNGPPDSAISAEDLPAANPPPHDNLFGTSESNHPPVREGGDDNRSMSFSDGDMTEGIWSGTGDVEAYEKWRQSGPAHFSYGKFWTSDEMPRGANYRLGYAYPLAYGYAKFKVKCAFELYRDGIFNGSDSAEVSVAKGVEFRKAAAEMAALPHSKEYPLDAYRIPGPVALDLRNYRSLSIVSGWKDQVPVSEPEAVRALVEAGVLDPNNPEIDPRVTLGWPDEVLARGDSSGPAARVENPVGDDTQSLDSGEHVVPAQGEPESTHTDALLESPHDRDQRRELGRRFGHEAALTALPDDVVWAAEDAMATRFEKAPLYATRIPDDRVPGGSRVLHFRVAGDPHGYPILMSPGSPVGVDGPLPDLKELTDRGFALITVERPGYGDSTRLPDREVADCARDIMYVADLFALDRYSVLGRSGGGSTAISVGALDPGRVERVVSLVGLAPKLEESGDWSAGMGEANKAAFFDGAIMKMAQRTGERGEWLLALNEDYFTELDYKWAGWNSDLLAKSYQRGLREDREAWVDDVIQAAQPWGIEFDDYRVPVDLVHGTVDQFSPVQHSYTNALLIPTSKLFLYDGVSHMMGLDSLPVIVSHFRSERDAYMSDMDEYHPGRFEQVRAADAKPLPFPRWQLWHGVGWKPRPELGHTGPAFRPLGL
ncbi:alpha/beta fold hydrolase [Nocardia sp. NPDC049220]|uniref:alpha/beta fold hydrolase n=1 Tax=Nocardia sp. NPDC049220 TaxID=3155273 RepID=UPI0033EBC9DD